MPKNAQLKCFPKPTLNQKGKTENPFFWEVENSTNPNFKKGDLLPWNKFEVDFPTDTEVHLSPVFGPMATFSTIIENGALVPAGESVKFPSVAKTADNSTVSHRIAEFIRGGVAIKILPPK